MTIDITDKTIGIWIVDFIDGNWCGHLERGQQENEFLFNYRFYYFAENKKNWWQRRIIEKNEDVAISNIRKFVDRLPDILKIAKFGGEFMKEKKSVKEFMEEILNHSRFGIWHDESKTS